MAPDTKKVETNIGLLRRWRNNCHRSQIANYDAANHFSKRNYSLGVPTVILSAIVGTSVFAAIESEVDDRIQIAVGIISITAAVLAALQTFMNWGERASKCRSTAAEYGSIKRQIDQLLSANTDECKMLRENIDNIRKQMDTLSKEGPELPKGVWKRARKAIPTQQHESST